MSDLIILQDDQPHRRVDIITFCSLLDLVSIQSRSLQDVSQLNNTTGPDNLTTILLIIYTPPDDLPIIIQTNKLVAILMQ